MAKSSRTADTMQIGLCILGKVKVDDYVDCLDIDTTRQQVRAHQVATDAVSKVVKHTVTMALQHSGVRVEARVAQLCDLFSQQLHAVC